MKKKINMKKVAELSGVSVATVSRVINQNGRFSLETEERVRKVIAAYQYVPNSIAKGLRTEQTKVVGIVVPDILNSHFARLVLQLEKELFLQSYSTLICNTNEEVELEQRHIKTLISQQVSGIILISGNRRYIDDSPKLIYLDRRPKGFEEKENLILVDSDNEEGGYLAARHLLEKGCRRMAIMKAEEVDCNQQARSAGFERALRTAGIFPDPENMWNLQTVSVNAARECVERELASGKQFDGIVCTTDELAVGAISGLKEAGMNVPGDVKVIGFDNSSIAENYDPPISSISQNIVGMAEITIQLLMERIQNRVCREHHVTVPVCLVERKSTNE